MTSIALCSLICPHNFLEGYIQVKNPWIPQCPIMEHGSLITTGPYTIPQLHPTLRGAPHTLMRTPICRTKLSHPSNSHPFTILQAQENSSGMIDGLDEAPEGEAIWIENPGSRAPRMQSKEECSGCSWAYSLRSTDSSKVTKRGPEQGHINCGSQSKGLSYLGLMVILKSNCQALLELTSQHTRRGSRKETFSIC